MKGSLLLLILAGCVSGPQVGGCYAKDGDLDYVFKVAKEGKYGYFVDTEAGIIYTEGIGYWIDNESYQIDNEVCKQRGLK